MHTLCTICALFVHFRPDIKIKDVTGAAWSTSETRDFMENHALYVFDHANLNDDQFRAFYNIVTSCCFLTRRTQLRDKAKRTQEAKLARDRMIAGFAVLETLFGETEKAQMCHVALNHAFNMVSEYGVTPSCYASEGVIGSIKQGVGSRKHPEVNMIKNYMRLNSSKTINLYLREEDPDDDSTPVRDRSCNKQTILLYLLCSYICST